jgi:hypothetical protein
MDNLDSLKAQARIDRAKWRDFICNSPGRNGDYFVYAYVLTTAALDKATRTHSTWSDESVAERAGLSTKTAQRARQWLESIGAVRTIRRGDGRIIRVEILYDAMRAAEREHGQTVHVAPAHGGLHGGLDHGQIVHRDTAQEPAFAGVAAPAPNPTPGTPVKKSPSGSPRFATDAPGRQDQDQDEKQQRRTAYYLAKALGSDAKRILGKAENGGRGSAELLAAVRDHLGTFTDEELQDPALRRQVRSELAATLSTSAKVLPFKRAG